VTPSKESALIKFNQSASLQEINVAYLYGSMCCPDSTSAPPSGVITAMR